MSTLRSPEVDALAEEIKAGKVQPPARGVEIAAVEAMAPKAKALQDAKEAFTRAVLGDGGEPVKAYRQYHRAWQDARDEWEQLKRQELIHYSALTHVLGELAEGPKRHLKAFTEFSRSALDGYDPADEAKWCEMANGYLRALGKEPYVRRYEDYRRIIQVDAPPNMKLYYHPAASVDGKPKDYSVMVTAVLDAEAKR